MATKTRNPGTDCNGNSFDHDTRSKVWWKAQEIPGKDRKEWAMDVCGATIRWQNHGDTGSPRGWEIDHIIADANGGGDELTNLQPLHWRNNRRKGDNPPDSAFCVVQS